VVEKYSREIRSIPEEDLRGANEGYLLEATPSFWVFFAKLGELISGNVARGPDPGSLEPPASSPTLSTAIEPESVSASSPNPKKRPSSLILEVDSHRVRLGTPIVEAELPYSPDEPTSPEDDITRTPDQLMERDSHRVRVGTPIIEIQLPRPSNELIIPEDDVTRTSDQVTIPVEKPHTPEHQISDQPESLDPKKPSPDSKEGTTEDPTKDLLSDFIRMTLAAIRNTVAPLEWPIYVKDIYLAIEAYFPPFSFLTVSSDHMSFSLNNKRVVVVNDGCIVVRDRQGKWTLKDSNNSVKSVISLEVQYLRPQLIPDKTQEEQKPMGSCRPSFL